MINTFIIIFGAFIAFQQWRTNEKRRKDDFFDRRYKFYTEVKEIIFDDVWGLYESSAEERKRASDLNIKLRNLMEESRFLFSSDVYCFLKKIAKIFNEKITGLWAVNRVNIHFKNKELPKNLQSKLDDFYRINDDFEQNYRFKEAVVEEVFKKYLVIHKNWEDDLISMCKNIKRGCLVMWSRYQAWRDNKDD